MRCQRAQKWMTAAVDGELAPRRRRALDAHLAACAACRRELAVTERMLAALEGLPMEAAVSPRLEQATLRRVRLAAADEAERGPASRWTRWLPLPAFALATAAVLVLAFGIVRRTGQVPGAPAVRPVPTAVAKSEPPAPPSALRPPPRIAKGGPPPAEPPAKLAEAPDLFMDMPIIRNLDKLENFEAIRTTTLDDEPATPDGQEPPSNG
jgi:anti-sigma factor RsiW